VFSTTWSGGGTLPSGLATTLASALTTSVSTDSTGSGAGTVGFSFSAADSTFDFLAAGETLTVTYNVTVTDINGLSSTKPVTITITITITGTNDAPVLAADAGSPHAIGEIAGVTGTATADTATGSLTFTDVDLTDTHTVGSSVFSTTWSGGGTLPSGLATTLASALTTSVSTDSTGSGAGTVGFSFSFSAADSTFDFLAAGETLTVTYNVTVTDINGLSSTKPVTITITINGSNDAAIISGTVIGSVIEAGGVGNAIAGTPTATGTLTDTDVDNPANTFTAVTTATASDNHYGTFTMTAAGVWTYTLNNDNATVQALNVGGTLTDTFTVTTVDGTQQLITVTINGSNDAAIISGTVIGSVIEAGGVGNAIAGTPTATGTLTDTDVDNPANTFTAVTTATASDNHYGTFTMTAAGVWTYTLNNDNATVQALNVGRKDRLRRSDHIFWPV
jgi:VCBS repeat-containing protein